MTHSGAPVGPPGLPDQLCRGGDQSIVEVAIHLLPTADQIGPASVAPHGEGATNLLGAGRV